MNLPYHFHEIASIVGSSSSKQHPIRQIIIDSRKPLRGKDVLFCALRGEVNDGHDYIPELIDSGCSFLVEEIPEGISDPSNFIVVQDTLSALQKLAAYHRDQMDYPVVGITGSNGKTTVKEWLYHLLRPHFNMVRSPKSYNSQVGVPLSLFELRPEHDLAMIEAGISRPGEMEKLERMIRPDRGIYLGAKQAHIENFGSVSIHEEKIKLFKDVKAVVGQDKWFDDSDLNSFCWSHEEGHPVLVRWEKSETGTEFEINFEPEVYHFSIPFQDDASIENAMSCCAYIMRFHPSLLPDILPRFSTLESLALRMEIVDGNHGCTLVNDAYNSDVEGLYIALDLLSRQTQSHRVVILSSIVGDQEGAEQLYARVAEQIQPYAIDQFILVGSSIKPLADRLNNASWFETSEEVLQSGLLNFKDSAILIKGARKFRFEKIAHVLQRITHETRLEVNLTALKNNYDTYRKRTHPSAKLMAMVKAFGYGSGDTEVAKQLAYQGVDYFGVAYADEGIALRKGGIQQPIMVMNAEEAAFQDIIDYNLEPVIYGRRVLDRFARALIDNDRKDYPIHLEVETGMNRLGIRENDLSEVLETVVAQPEVRVVSVFSHLSVSDDPKEDRYSKQQIERFNQMSTAVQERLGYSVLRHLCNTAGIVRFPEAHYDMVRLGVGLYGVDSAQQLQPIIEPVGRLLTTISQIHTLPEDESIGYGRVGQGRKGDRIGILPIGYADGLKRSLSNGVGMVSIHGKRVPIIGNVCMDMTMVLLNDVAAEEGDEVEIFGSNISLQELADQLDTIPYEVLTSVSQRVKRVYVQD